MQAHPMRLRRKDLHFEYYHDDGQPLIRGSSGSLSKNLTRSSIPIRGGAMSQLLLADNPSQQLLLSSILPVWQ